MVPGGTFYRSYDRADSGDLSAPATVSTFRLDKYDVTVGRFRAFVEDGKGTRASPPVVGSGEHPNLPGSGWEAAWTPGLTADSAALKMALVCYAIHTWNDVPGAQDEDRPIGCLTWYEAIAFCAWDGGYLPTETEWNYAAAGGDQQRAYPWSDPPDALGFDNSYTSYGDGSNCYGDGAAGCGPTDIVAVGTKPGGDGRWGHSDLIGNVFNWTLDWQYQYPVPCVDCAEIEPGDHRTVRGSSYARPPARTGTRNALLPIVRQESIGLRCARRP